jgi:hypothetical protein
MSLLVKVKKWLYRNKRRKYSITYVATGFMGNRYKAGKFEFSVSDNCLSKFDMNPAQHGFNLNRKALEVHFNLVNGTGEFSYIMHKVEE